MQDDGSRGLVDDAAPRPGTQSGTRQIVVRGHGREPLVDEPHRHLAGNLGKLGSVTRRRGSGGGASSGQRQRKPDDDLDRAKLSHQLGKPAQVAPAAVAVDRLERRREHAVRVADRDADPHTAHVDAQARAGPHVDHACWETVASTAARASSTAPGLVPPP